MVGGELKAQALVEREVEECSGIAPVDVFFALTRGHILEDIVGVGVLLVGGDVAPLVRRAGIHTRNGHLQVLETGGKVHHTIILALAEKLGAGGEPLGELYLHVGADVELGCAAAHPVVAHNTLVVHIAKRGVGLHSLRAAREGQAVPVHKTVVERFLKPVRVGIGYAFLDAVGIEAVRIRLRIFPKGDGLVGIGMGDAHVVGALVAEAHRLGIVGHIAELAEIGHLEGEIVVVGDVDSAGGAALGRDEYDAVGGAAAVDCR